LVNFISDENLHNQKQKPEEKGRRRLTF
jgi:hypothetical protein